MRVSSSTLVAVLACWAAVSLAQSTSTVLPPIDIVRDVRYGQVGDATLLLDIYRPKVATKQPLPAVVWVHGGAWRYGDKEKPMAGFLAYGGYFVVSIEYRLAPFSKFPAALEDCKCAVRWLRANASTMHVDPERIGVWGASAGGHLAAMVGLTADKKEFEGGGGHADQSSAVRAVCAFFPPTDLMTLAEQFPDQNDILVGFLGDFHNRIPDAYRRASPITYVTKLAPAFLLVHGEADRVVPISQSEALDSALRKAGVDVTFLRVKNADHSLKAVKGEPIVPTYPELQRAVFLFFNKHLKKQS